MTTFKALERTGWTEKAAAYDQYFSGITEQAISPMLDAAGDVRDRTLLDLCCGTGNLAAAALAREARVTGVDFAPTMIEAAKRKVTGADFRIGDAEALDFPDESFDAVLCAFGLNHLAEPERAIGEVARVLKPQGLLVYTLWRPSQEGWDLFDLVMKAIQKHGTLEVDLPAAPSQFRLADEGEAKAVLAARGLRPVAIQYLMATWTGRSGQLVLDLIHKSLVRTPMVINAQTEQARAAIDEEIRAGADAMRANGEIHMRWPYALVSATHAV
jgi:ubiquinone/menaquinone biosynthesis C-methylase UbiE